MVATNIPETALAFPLPPRRPSFLLPLLLTLLLPASVLRAQDPAGHIEPKPRHEDPVLLDLPPLPPEAKVRQSITLDGRALGYTCSVQALPVRDEKGRKVAEVVCTSYLAGDPASRPVTFAVNGGPGSSSMWLNLGALGPRRVSFGAPEDEPSDPPRFQDNPGTWLDFTDLVFIDPVGTGYSRALVDGDEAARRFYTIQGDAACLARVVHDWLAREGRLASPKFLVGESYGAFRAPRIAAALQNDLGVNLAGLVLVSPILDGSIMTWTSVSPLPWMVRLPTLAAARLERQGRLGAGAMAPVEAYARTEFAADLLRGWSDPAALERLSRRVAEYTGLDPDLVRREGGRVGDSAGQREPFRAQGRVGSPYDLNWTLPDPYPWDLFPHGDVDALWKAQAILSGAMVQFFARTVGWRPEARYIGINQEVNAKWETPNANWWPTAESVSHLRKVLALDGRLKVLFAHGWTDLVTPYFASRLIVDQLPPLGDPGRVRLKVYPGGHMFYARPESLKAFHDDGRALVLGR